MAFFALVIEVLRPNRSVHRRGQAFPGVATVIRSLLQIACSMASTKSLEPLIHWCPCTGTAGHAGGAVQEFQASLVALQHVAEALAQQHAQCSAASALRSLGWQVWLGIVAIAGHAQQLLSGADVAALLLSRRLLLQRDPFEAHHEVMQLSFLHHDIWKYRSKQWLLQQDPFDAPIEVHSSILHLNVWKQQTGCSSGTPSKPPMR